MHIENPRPLRFVKGTMEMSYPDAFVYPILASFRKNVDHRGWTWRDDPFVLWEKKKNDVASAVKDAVGTFQSSNKMGKAGLMWRTCYDAI